MGASTTKTTSESKPPAWATPLFTQSAGEAQKLYASGAGGNVYQGPTVAGLGGTTQSGISGVKDAANAWNTTGPVSATNLQDMASGNYLKSGNPYFEDALKGQLDNTAAQVQSQFSGSGRYGSGANTNALTTQLGNIRAGALSNQFNQDTQNMLAANGQIDTSNANWLQGRLGAQQDVIQAGQLQDQNAQDQLSADLNKFQAEDNAPWTRLGLLQSAASGSAGNYGTNVSTQTTPFNPFSAIGTVLGGATQAAKKSDIRLKENLSHVGEKNGHRLYEWNYIGDPARFRGVMAQEVLKIQPEAVVMEDDGFYAVRYDLIGIEMEAV